MTSTLADHNHNVFAREEPRHAVIQTTVQLMVILGFHDGPHDPRISTNVYLQALVTVGSSNFLQSIIHIERPLHTPG